MKDEVYVYRMCVVLGAIVAVAGLAWVIAMAVA